jgi:hypothetical protein
MIICKTKLWIKKHAALLKEVHCLLCVGIILFGCLSGLLIMTAILIISGNYLVSLLCLLAILFNIEAIHNEYIKK